ncbi:MAG: universal stress protein [Chloroflexi bacterium]|nr:MAG: hypothetical protein CUN54_05220 [Phototrophicales bacterium]RMF79758.1 MAG: universal stress protein [Chloroflexota bacterium]
MAEVNRYKKIVVPVDGSGWSERAIPHAADIARANGAELILLHVFRPPAADYIGEMALAGQDSQINEMREQMKQRLIGLRSELRGEGLEVRTQVIEGVGVANVICEYINSEHIDLVVMSTRGRTGLTRFLFGSVANKVIQCVEVPVLLIRPDKDEG